MKGFLSLSGDYNSNTNPLEKVMTLDEFQYMLEEGFKLSRLDCYADLEGSICYWKRMEASNGWDINMYITELGVALDYDYSCGGNSSNFTWWFKDYCFKDAYNEMVKICLEYCR
jgi:hypothetical protein